MTERTRQADLTFALLALVIMVACRQRSDKPITSEGMGANEKISRAKATLQTLPQSTQLFGYGHAYGLLKFALEQWQFSGVVAQEGCLARFDSQCRLVSARTMKLLDYFSGRRTVTRELMWNELLPSKQQLEAYCRKFYSRGIVEDVVIPVLSNSFRIAVADAVLNDSPFVAYAFRRSGEALELLRIQQGIPRVVASEEMFRLARGDVLRPY